MVDFQNLKGVFYVLGGKNFFKNIFKYFSNRIEKLHKMAFIIFFFLKKFEKVWKSFKNWNYPHKIFIANHFPASSLDEITKRLEIWKLLEKDNKTWGLLSKPPKYFFTCMKNFNIEHDLASLHMPCREELMWSLKKKRRKEKWLFHDSTDPLEQSHHWPRNSSSESSIHLIEG